MPPMRYLDEWSARDRGLAEALLEFEAGVGPHGIPWRDALDPEAEGWFEVEQVTDHAQAAIDQWHKANPKPQPGTRVRVIDARRSHPAAGEDRSDDQDRRDQQQQ